MSSGPDTSISTALPPISEREAFSEQTAELATEAPATIQIAPPTHIAVSVEKITKILRSGDTVMRKGKMRVIQDVSFFEINDGQFKVEY